MLGGFGTGWLSLGTKTSCPDFSLSARAGVLALEREKHPSSISCAGLDARAGVGPLERECGSDARAGSWTLERVSSLSRCWECASAARAWYCPLERESVSVRSSGSLSARAGRLSIKSCFSVLKQFFIFFSYSKP